MGMGYGKLWYGCFMFKNIENWEYVIDGHPFMTYILIV